MFRAVAEQDVQFRYTLEMRNREINNGRFAMFAAIGIIAANVYTGKDAIEQFGAWSKVMLQFLPELI